ncbi:hypothetical protein GCM10023108_18930 [Saccharopolyspora hordei]
MTSTQLTSRREMSQDSSTASSSTRSGIFEAGSPEPGATTDTRVLLCSIDSTDSCGAGVARQPPAGGSGHAEAYVTLALLKTMRVLRLR